MFKVFFNARSNVMAPCEHVVVTRHNPVCGFFYSSKKFYVGAASGTIILYRRRKKGWRLRQEIVSIDIITGPCSKVHRVKLRTFGATTQSNFCFEGML